jgi:aspartyl-tRNA(Asn)/glutamyl-tRNA(Gln) amidotransferase subunit A
MADTDLAFSPVYELSAAIRGGRLSPVELVEALLARIARHDEKQHAFVTVYADEARQAARAAEGAIRSGHAVGPLHGIPVALKDIIDVAGRITTGGSYALKDRVSPVTATLARKLIAAGMIVIGKTHSVEFAMGGWGTNEHMGTPWNPWDPDVLRAPGGSSSGTGVAVSSGFAPWGIGTDTGGSVRLPSSWCGLTGLKTTVGRVSCYGVLPLASTLDTPGPMARSVEDAALLYNAMQGPDPLDPMTRGVAFADPLPRMRRGVGGLRLALMPADARDGVDPEVLAALDASVETLRALGASVEEVSLPCAFSEMGGLAGDIIGAEGYHFVGDLVDDLDLPIDRDVRPRIWRGRDMTARTYLDALKKRREVKREFDAALAGYDALLTPTTATPAPVAAEIDQSTTPAIFTRAVNVLDRCALAIPNGFTKAGLPTSLHIVCDGYDEAMALRIGWAYEQATDWNSRRPPL